MLSVLVLGATQTITPDTRSAMDNPVMHCNHAARADRSAGRQMKRMEGKSDEKDSQAPLRIDAESVVGSTTARADAVLDWNAIAVNTAVANKQNPFAQARYAAIVQLAVFEAVNSITHKYQPYLGTITAPPGASPDAAAIEAAYQVLSTYFPASQPTLYADWTNSMQSIPDGPGKTDGIATGDAAAAAMIALRANDGSSPPQFYTPGRLFQGHGRRHPVARL